MEGVSGGCSKNRSNTNGWESGSNINHSLLEVFPNSSSAVDTEGGLPGPGMGNVGKDAQNPSSTLHGMPADALRTDGHSHLGRGIDLRPSPAGTAPGFHGNPISPLFLFHRLSRSSLHPPPPFQKGRVGREQKGEDEEKNILGFPFLRLAVLSFTYLPLLLPGRSHRSQYHLRILRW
ncbi:hypothetical protein AVEN_178599-1 [Araneus ventricosus]|uniref:Uncharacterized protein n=1 Tax=Araneus ventricosus TaxID=182803 RepID=A0A4Y2TSZ3_ARAVE|nr:hypothetical protein AVEN_64487-1 [Araneus ventricosus]GBO03677.1 hypothetical protein AVEN_162520-1 [Araneus ventricosus]GBO03754.1 hypothetical protein AVEN_81062-1 [Araneus ventricosus]GBO03759.1 hypothetical protein AVEN_178599-1 [Araneus ventricosus]